MARTDLQSRDYESRQLDIQKKEYAIRRRRQTISVIPIGLLGVAVAVGGGGLFGLGEQAVLVLVGSVVLSFFGFSLVNWRCPKCSAYLGQRLNPTDCRACGATLQD